VRVEGYFSAQRTYHIRFYVFLERFDASCLTNWGFFSDQVGKKHDNIRVGGNFESHARRMELDRGLEVFGMS
jgi:hypothetical protein